MTTTTETTHIATCAECGHHHYDTPNRVYLPCPLTPDCDCLGQDEDGNPVTLLSLPCGCLTYGSLVTEFCDEHEPVTCACGCDTLITDDTGSDWCGRHVGTIHPDHHGHWGDCY